MESISSEHNSEQQKNLYAESMLFVLFVGIQDLLDRLRVDNGLFSAPN